MNQPGEQGRLRRWERVCLFALGCTVFVLGLPHLPPGICFGDSGDLQVASAVLGICHPPGYVGFVAVGWLLTKLFFFVDPAYVVSLACVTSIAGALVLLAATLVRLGLHVAIAGAVSLLLLLHNLVWLSLTAPEVYAPSLVCLAGSMYLFSGYAGTGRRLKLALAAALFGFLVINRPSAILYLPGFVGGLIMVEHRAGRLRAIARPLALSVAAAMLPMVATFGLLIVRDSPGTAYNYLEIYRAEHDDLPARDGSLTTRFERARWLVRGVQFQYLVGGTSKQMWSKVRWLRTRLHLNEIVPSLCVALVLAIGLVLLFRRCAPLEVVLLGTGLGAIAFAIIYREFGQAADLLPVLLCGAVLAGVAFIPLFPRSPVAPVRGVAAIGLSVAVAVGVSASVLSRTPVAEDATDFLREIDVSTLPPETTVIVGWGQGPSLYYAREFFSDRPDVTILIANPGRWFELASRAKGAGPILLAEKLPTPE